MKEYQGPAYKAKDQKFKSFDATTGHRTSWKQGHQQPYRPAIVKESLANFDVQNEKETHLVSKHDKFPKKNTTPYDSRSGSAQRHTAEINSVNVTKSPSDIQTEICHLPEDAVAKGRDVLSHTHPDDIPFLKRHSLKKVDELEPYIDKSGEISTDMMDAHQETPELFPPREIWRAQHKEDESSRQTMDESSPIEEHVPRQNYQVAYRKERPASVAPLQDEEFQTDLSNRFKPLPNREHILTSSSHSSDSHPHSFDFDRKDTIPYRQIAKRLTKQQESFILFEQRSH